ncbi:MAG TPA: hypothetical protein VEK07_17680 [Polyangiaceae bacterium]|nr:hypothetical protein [Polyangiaceae bacterium]
MGRSLTPPARYAGKLVGAIPWVGGWLRDRASKGISRRADGEQHLLFAICDHFEPLHGRASGDVGLMRVRAWRQQYPSVTSRFRDASDRAPRHTFFFPGEEYSPALVEPLAELVGLGLGEVEVHLHHDGDTRMSLADKLERTLGLLGSHGVVPRLGGSPAWSFIHGNWALANGRPDGRFCGVDDELALLRGLGCYADFTFPSAPDPCQPSVVNAIYYARDDTRRRAYEKAEPVTVGASKRNRVLLIQGPLALARRGPRGRALRIESAALHACDPPTRVRLATWIDQWIHVPGRPDWTFVKLHSHGAPERNARIMLGAPIEELHVALQALATDGWRIHYVTAREMYNVVRAAMDGKDGSPAAYFDYEIPPPERARK